MNCDCILEIGKQVEAQYREKAGEGVKAELLEKGIMNNGQQYVLQTLSTYRVNGPNKGFNTQKGQRCVIPHNYCPFCGKVAIPGVSEENSTK